MRTTVRLDPKLLAAVKKTAAETGRTMTAIIEEALRQTLARRAPVKRRTVKLTTVKGRGPLPGVDLDDSAALSDLMETRPRHGAS